MPLVPFSLSSSDLSKVLAYVKCRVQLIDVCVHEWGRGHGELDVWPQDLLIHSKFKSRRTCCMSDLFSHLCRCFMDVLHMQNFMLVPWILVGSLLLCLGDRSFGFPCGSGVILVAYFTPLLCSVWIVNHLPCSIPLGGVGSFWYAASAIREEVLESREVVRHASGAVCPWTSSCSCTGV